MDPHVKMKNNGPHLSQVTGMNDLTPTSDQKHTRVKKNWLAAELRRGRFKYIE